MRRGSLLAACLLLGAAAAPAQQTNPQGEPRTILLWDHGAPGALGDEDADKPSLTFYPPNGRQATGTAVIVAPGGGYTQLAMNQEGRQAANWLNSNGVSAFVLKYRLGPRYKYPVQLRDAQRAVRLIRARAQEFAIAPDRIGMLGFSAGGHLSAMAGTHFDSGNPQAADAVERESSRPDFLILAYALITFDPKYRTEAVAVAQRNLLGQNTLADVLEDVAADYSVTAQTPPSFLFSGGGDQVVFAEQSIDFYLAARKAGVPVELHIFETGRHGVGLALNDPESGEWPLLLTNWLRGRGLLMKQAH
jgi:acetyl esterase/lipase